MRRFNPAVLYLIAPLLEEPLLPDGTHEVQKIKTGLTVFFIVLAIPILIALFFALRFIYKNTIGRKFETSLIEDYKNEADEYEKSGRFVSAAGVYEEKLGDTKKAASLYEKGKDFRKAAELYELLGLTGKAKEMYEKGGNIREAAEVSASEGEYEEAAKLYAKSGDNLKAAKAMEKAGRKLAAARAYREAGEYKRASVLLEELGMTKAAAEMFGFSLAGKKVGISNIEDFYTFAVKLDIAEEKDRASEIFKEIDRFNPAFKDVRERLVSLSHPSVDETNPGCKATLRSFINSGRIEPKNSLKLWVQILKNLQEAYNIGRVYGVMCPDNICIDSQNNISFTDGTPSSAYIAPETARGVSPDIRADIFSMGVVLYEMLTGNLEGLGSVRVVDLIEDVPDWLDEIVIRCIRKVREDRYQSIEDIFTDLKALSKNRQA